MIRTMEYLGEDFWGRPVYKCVETGDLYKDITLGSELPELCSCGNDFEGEPDCPISEEYEIRFIDATPKIDPDTKFNYMLLDRLRMDCDYYLGNGNRNVKHLWAATEKEHIQKMKDLHNSFSDDAKPEWLTYEQILKYEELMVVSQ